MGKVGRPKGHKVSEKTKTLIRLSRYGKRHSTATKQKISKGLYKYFGNSVFKDLLRMYQNYPDALRWIRDREKEIRSWGDVVPENRLRTYITPANRKYVDNLFYGLYEID